MAFNQKPSETGWFYHAPAKAKHADAVGVPPASQIPGLCGDHPGAFPPEEPRKALIRDTDSKYIRLAKQGGRQDLLRFRTPKPKSDKPVGYPRADWYYQEDFREEKPELEEPYVFMLPDYMVHQTIQDIRSKRTQKPQSQTKEKAQQKRAPYANDKETVYQREGNPTDKNVRLPELRQPGFGVRAEKMEGKPVKQAPVKRTEPIKPPTSELTQQNRRPVMPPQHENEKYCMGKILSNGYQREWEDDKNKWESKQEKMREKFDNSPHPKERMQSEYQEKIEANASKRGSAQNGSRRESASDKEMKKIKARKEKEDADKPEFFKLSKFKNVPAKTQSHRHSSNQMTMAAN